MPSFPELGFFSAKTSALPIDSEIVPDVGTVVTGEDDHRVVDEFVTGSPRVFGFSKGLEQGSKRDVVFQHHILSVSRFDTVGVNAFSFDRDIGDRVRDGLRATRVLLEMIGIGDIVEKEG